MEEIPAPEVDIVKVEEGLIEMIDKVEVQESKKPLKLAKHVPVPDNQANDNEDSEEEEIRIL